LQSLEKFKEPPYRPANLTPFPSLHVLLALRIRASEPHSHGTALARQPLSLIDDPYMLPNDT